MHILIVDDYRPSRLVLAHHLSRLGHVVSEAGDGLEALAQWRQQPFDLIISDCHMPNMDGFQLARAIRSEERSSGQPPCLLLGCTGNHVSEERERCLQAGMDECLGKPLGLEQLASYLQRVQLDSDDDGYADELTAQSLDEQLKQLARGNPATQQALRAELLASSRQVLRALPQLLATEDRQALAQLAHQLKGSARLLNFEALLIRCSNLEAVCLRAGSHEQLKLELMPLTESVGQLVRWLEPTQG